MEFYGVKFRFDKHCSRFITNAHKFPLRYGMGISCAESEARLESKTTRKILILKDMLENLKPKNNAIFGIYGLFIS